MAHETPRFRDMFSTPAESNGELWVPAQDVASGSPPFGEVPKQPQFPFEFPYEWNLPSESSTFSSPVESVAGSNETESEEDNDYTAGLAERIAHSMLDDDENSEEKSNVKSWASEQRNPWAADAGKVSLAVSPQSTLPGIGSWSACSWSSNSAASSNGSSRVSSQVSSPPSTPLEVENDAWDLLYAAAGEVVRLKMNEDRRAAMAGLPPRSGGSHQPPVGCVAPLRANQQQRSQVSWKQTHLAVVPPLHLPPSGLAKDVPMKSNSFSSLPSSAYCREKPVAATNYLQRSSSAKARDEERKLAGGQHLRSSKHGGSSSWSRSSRSILQHPSCGGSRGGPKAGSGHRSLWANDLSPAHFPPLQPTGGSGMRAVFLGTTGSRESGGTGVFLPRRIGSGPESKKKPVCSTVLLPSRIVQALNLNVEDILSSPIVPSASSPLPLNRRVISTEFASPPPTSIQSNGSSGGGSNGNLKGTAGRDIWAEHQWRSGVHPSCSPLQEAAPEISLPTEWTY